MIMNRVITVCQANSEAPDAIGAENLYNKKKEMIIK